MIQITRSLARQLRAILRKASVVRGAKPPLEFRSYGGELRIRVELANVNIEYREAGPSHQETLLLPSEALDDLQGRKDLPITLEKVGESSIQATWQEASVPQTKTYQAPQSPNRNNFPDPPSKLHLLGRGFLDALNQAVQVAGTHVRYATDKLQLRGSKGSITATDGRQVLIQSGFTFSWKEDFLIPALPLFGCPELPEDEQVFVGKGTNTSPCKSAIGPSTSKLTARAGFPTWNRFCPKPHAI